MRRLSKSLSSALEHRLSGYALAASAAGVGILSLVSPTEFILPTGVVIAGLFSLSESAESKIVYTPADKHINCGAATTTTNVSLTLRLNHRDGDFRIDCFQAGHNGSLTVDPIGKKNEVWTTTSSMGRHWAAALRKGAIIKSNPGFRKSTQIGMWWCSYKTCYGPWLNVKNRYLGFKFFINGKAHYGWARWSTVDQIKLTGYAYESVPNKPIIAGKTHGKDVITVEPASLGALAAGANGLHRWRQK
jgi:hypothetical protein